MIARRRPWLLATAIGARSHHFRDYHIRVAPSVIFISILTACR
jgi:hypothetical protein